MTGVELYIGRLEGSGRAAERRAVETLFYDALGCGTGHYPDGAPYAEGREDVALSVSHGAGYAVVAFGLDPHIRLGVDIEGADRLRQLERVRSRFVGPDDSTSLGLLRLWTAKEAVYKAARHPGLSLTAIAVGPEWAVALGRRYQLEWRPVTPVALLCLAAAPSHSPTYK